MSLAAAFLLVGGTAGWLIHGSPKASPAVAAAENTVARGPKGAVVGAAPVAPSCASAVSDSTYVGPVSWRNSTVLEFTVGTPTTAFVLVSPGTCAIVATIPVPQS